MSSENFKELNQLSRVAEEVLSEAKKQGATAAEVTNEIEDGFSVTVRIGDLETIEYHKEKHCGITVYFGQRKGIVNTSDTRPEALKESVKAACTIAQFTEEDDCAGLADKALMAKEWCNLDLHHPWKIEPAQAIDMALECEEYARSLDSRICNSEGVSISTHQSFHVYANSHGFLGAIPSTYHNLHCVLIAKEQEKSEQMERDYDYTVARDVKELRSGKAIAQSAVERAINRLGAKKLSTRKVPVIFSADVARSLIGNFVSAISGTQLYRKASFLVDHLGEPVFPDHVCIDERPHLLKGLGSTPFDNEGVATQEKSFVKEGVLTSYVLSSYSARKLQMQPTANAGGVHNLFVQTSDLDLPQLLKKMDTGVLVTELIGQGVNLLTGDYSRGAVGFWVERGEIQYPVSEITIAGNLREMYKRFVTVGNDVDNRGNIKTGSILLEEMMVAGN